MKMKFKKIGVTMLLTLLCATVLISCGGKSFDENKNISVVTREDGSGTKSAFMEIIGLKGKNDLKGIIVATGTAGVMAEVESNPLALAYESLGFVSGDVKVLSVDGVAATAENINNGTYKIARPLSIVYKENSLSSATNAAFLNFLKSASAQSLITSNGYVSTQLTPAEYVIESNLQGEISISGSTSLQPLMIVLADKFKELQSGVSITVSGGGSGTGYKNAQNGVSEFGMISEEFKSEKAEGCVYYEIAKDGIAIIVNKSNPIKDISTANIKAIYDCDGGDAAIFKWSQIG